jgi:sugar phosphate isomerase/epimerase
MQSCLNADMIGWSAAPVRIVEAAAAHGFEAVDLPISATLDSGAVRDALARTGVAPGCACGLIPFRFMVSDGEWDRVVEDLPTGLAVAAALGFRRMPAVVLPFHETLGYAGCMKLHVSRLRRIRPLLAEHAVRLGLEYVSPLTRRAGQSYPFLHSLAGLLDLLDELDDPVFGILLDSFHWFCARESAADLESLRDRIVAVHLSDAPAGRRREDQVALERELPCATGVIPLGEFMRGLRAAGYEGPVTAEPMNVALNALPPDDKLARTRTALEQGLAGDPGRGSAPGRRGLK